MSSMKNVKAMVRTECVAELLHALRDSGVTRIYLSRIQAVGGGTDPEDFNVSVADGSIYTEKAKVEFVCPADRAQDLVDIVRSWTRTGQRGDGVIIVSNVTDIVDVRTGDHNELALL